MSQGPLSPAELHAIDAYWRAANYLSVGQIYLLDNPLLRQALTLEHIKPRLLGHWGTTPGLNFIYAHLNRIIRRDDLDLIFIAGPGHGGPGVVANTYLEGTYSELYPEVSRDVAGLQRLCKQFSFPGGIPSHAAPETPGSIHEGGELGYSLAHAFGAAFDNPDLIVACVVGDGEAETGPLATAWHSNKFLNPVTDGAVLPILHLNGYKIASPTVLARISGQELASLFRRLRVPSVSGRRLGARRDAPGDGRVTGRRPRRDPHDPDEGALDRPGHAPPVADDHSTQPKGMDRAQGGRRQEDRGLLALPSGAACRHGTKPEHVKQLEQWMKSYRAEELFDDAGTLIPELADLPPRATGGWAPIPMPMAASCSQDLALPDFQDYAVDVPKPGTVIAEATRVLGGFLRDVMRLNLERRNFRVSARTRPPPTGWTRCSRSPTAPGWPIGSPTISS